LGELNYRSSNEIVIANSQGSFTRVCNSKDKSIADILGFDMEMTFWAIDNKWPSLETGQAFFWLRRSAVGVYKRLEIRVSVISFASNGQVVRFCRQYKLLTVAPKTFSLLGSQYMVYPQAPT
jgi:hypothetical protein